MALPQAAALLAASLTLAVGLTLAATCRPVRAEPSAPAPTAGPATVVSPPKTMVMTAPGPDGAEALDVTLSPECRVPGSKLYTLARLGAVKLALTEKRPVRVLTVGSSSAGPGASATYPVKLETALERSLPDVDVVVESRGMQGEIASGAAERLRNMVAEIEPDLVIWQVGTHDALARVDAEDFANALDETVQWIKGHEIDVVLVTPVYTASLAADEYYNSLVRKVQEVAVREGVPLVQRYEAMRYLSGQGQKGEGHLLGSQFRLNDLGLRCMAEHVTRAITLSLLQADTVVTGTTKTPTAVIVPPRDAAVKAASPPPSVLVAPGD
ncbi:lipolytic protein g-d-s-l family [Methylobacterium sp. Leaf469]|uniref:SGNH/GDSL hydrolase family protein n=1 Tax=unclassified Methylobacterium TaxID=2615210 RepID=UPI0006F382E9|nr:MULTISPECIES: GDSL-type esterase/lipase family protein [unclassified Methylobacterium]KQP30241.1 lipolytic protein g-d-s-l family [Methylobacterium sp. Leaf102]KQT98992.1 lipolytic protein g-d-s-l family [Methylobacterium sp. Leaf469]